jgi:hypothetical protein
MYSADPHIMKDYGAFTGVPQAMAKRVRDDFFPPSLVDPDEIHGLDSLMAEEVHSSAAHERAASRPHSTAEVIPPVTGDVHTNDVRPCARRACVNHDLQCAPRKAEGT